jgi:hypothetical protein
LLFFELLNEVHRVISIGSPQPLKARPRAPSILRFAADLAPVYGKAAALSPIPRF